MHRYLVLLVVMLAFALGAAACGGNGDEDEPAAEETGNGESTQADSNGESGGEEPARGPDRTPRAIPTATPVAEDGVLAIIAAGGEAYELTAREFAALPEVTITVDGVDYAGVPLSAIADLAGAMDAAFISMEGRSPEGDRLAVVSFALEEVHDNAVLLAGESGHLSLAGVDIPPGQWLTIIGAIDFS